MRSVPEFIDVSKLRLLHFAISSVRRKMLPFPLATDDGRREMNGFAGQALIWTTVAVLTLPARVNAQTVISHGITNGMSRADVIALLGTPKGNFVVGGSESLLFDHDTVTLQNGRVVSENQPRRSPSTQPAVAKNRPFNPTPPGADWPQWRGPNRNGVTHNSPPLASAWPDSGPKKIW